MITASKDVIVKRKKRDIETKASKKKKQQLLLTIHNYNGTSVLTTTIWVLHAAQTGKVDTQIFSMLEKNINRLVFMHMY